MEKMADVLEKIAAKLGVTSEYLWPRVVQAHVWESLIAVLLSLVVLAVGLWRFPKSLQSFIELCRRVDTREPDFVIPVIKVIVFGIVLVGGSIAVSGWWSMWLAAIFAPEGSLVLRALGR